MSNQVYALALKSTLEEIQNACPDVTSNFIFKDYDVLAKTENVSDATVTQTRNAFNDISEKADALGGLEAITIKSAKGKINIAAMNDLHLTTVSSKQADEKYINTLTRVLIPIVIKLVEEIQSALPETQTIPDEATETVEPEPVEETTEETTEETVDEPEVEFAQPEDLDEEPAMHRIYETPEPVELDIDNEPLLPEPPVTQLMVANLKGFRVPDDTVRVDEEVIAQWTELYSDKKIQQVEIEALNGRTTQCKVKQIKKSKDSGKGIIKMPEKIQVALETASGELVTVKPIVE
jgi:leucyl-tRNA synthetase